MLETVHKFAETRLEPSGVSPQGLTGSHRGYGTRMARDTTLHGIVQIRLDDYG